MNISRKEAVDQAIALHRISESGYIDVIKLANAFGVDVYLREMNEEEEGFIEYGEKDNEFYIVVNEVHGRKHQRFSIAHEIAHYILHKDKIKSRQRVDRQGKYSLSILEEKNADELAAEILMPEDLVRKFAVENEMDLEKALTQEVIDKLSEHFNVPCLVAIMRMRTLGSYVPYHVC